MKENVSAEHSRDRTRSTKTRNQQRALSVCKNTGREHVRQSRNHAAQQVKDHILHMAQTILDVVAEDPEKQHVARDVREAAVHEHRGEERQVNRARRWTKTRNRYALAHVLDDTRGCNYIVTLKNLRGHGRERVGELVVAAESLQN